MQKQTNYAFVPTRLLTQASEAQLELILDQLLKRLAGFGAVAIEYFGLPDSDAMCALGDSTPRLMGIQDCRHKAGLLRLHKGSRTELLKENKALKNKLKTQLGKSTSTPEVIPTLCRAKHPKNCICYPQIKPLQRPWVGVFLLYLEGWGAPQQTELLSNVLLKKQFAVAESKLLATSSVRFNPFRILAKPNALRVLSLIAQGWTVPQVAQELHLSPRGVEYHIDRLKQNLNANNRVHLVHLANHLQLL